MLCVCLFFPGWTLQQQSINQMFQKVAVSVAAAGHKKVIRSLYSAWMKWEAHLYNPKLSPSAVTARPGSPFRLRRIHDSFYPAVALSRVLCEVPAGAQAMCIFVVWRSRFFKEAWREGIGLCRLDTFKKWKDAADTRQSQIHKHLIEKCCQCTRRQERTFIMPIQDKNNEAYVTSITARRHSFLFFGICLCFCSV